MASPADRDSAAAAAAASAASQQSAAARRLIEQLVSNSDLLGEDDLELQRQRQRDDDEEADADEAHAAALAAADDAAADDAASSAFPPRHVRGGSAAVYTEGAHADPVSAAFENFGEITDDILAEWKEMFSLFDFDNTGFIRTDDLGTVLRGLGRNLTEALIGQLINSYDSNGSGALDFPTFYRLMCDNSPMPGPCHEKQVLADFHVFDMHRDGMLPVVDLVHLLRNLGEPLTRDDVDHLLQEIYIDGDNKVNIKDLVQHMFRTSAPNPE